MTTLSTIAALLAFNPASSNEAYVEGYYAAGDLGGGEFYYDGGSSATSNNGTIFTSSYGGRWFRVLNGTRVNVRWFGAYGNNSNDDAAAIQAAINYCGSTGLGLYVSKGTYLVSSAGSGYFSLLINYNGFSLEGDGFESEIKGYPSSPTKGLIGIVANSGNIQDVSVRNLNLNGNKANQSGAYYMKCIMVVCVSSNSTPLNVLLDGLYCHDAYTGSLEGGGISVTGDDQSYVMTDYYPQNVIISNCYCYNNAGWGIGTNFGNSIVISNNVCWNNDTQGITLWNTQDSVVSANRCYANGSYDFNTEICDRITISGNSSNSNQAAALRVFNTVDITIVGNMFTHNNYWYLNFAIGIVSGHANFNGITYKQRPCSNVQISSNMVKSTGSDGYVLSIVNPSDSNGSYAENFAININDNVFNNTATFKGVTLAATDVNFENNKVYGTLYAEASGGFINIDSNDIGYFNAPSGFNLITIGNGTNLLIKGNILRANQNGNDAVALTQLLSNAILFDNNWSGFTYLYQIYGSAVTPALRDNLNW